MAVESPAAKRREPLTDDSRPGTSQPRMIGSSESTRWSAWAGMLGGLLWALFPLGELPTVQLVLTPKGSLTYYSLGYLWATLLLLMGLQGLHTLRRRSYGQLGTLGFYLSFVALVLAFAGGAFEVTKTATTNTGSVGFGALRVGHHRDTARPSLVFRRATARHCRATRFAFCLHG